MVAEMGQHLIERLPPGSVAPFGEVTAPGRTGPGRRRRARLAGAAVGGNLRLGRWVPGRRLRREAARGAGADRVLLGASSPMPVSQGQRTAALMSAARVNVIPRAAMIVMLRRPRASAGCHLPPTQTPERLSAVAP